MAERTKARIILGVLALGVITMGITLLLIGN